MDDCDILKGLAHDTIVPGDPPKKRKCTSQQWKMGMQFLFFADNHEEIPNWFYCNKCDWIENAVLGGGTGNLINHARSHVTEVFKFSREQLEEAFKACAEYVKTTGKIPDFKKMPHPIDW